MAEPWMTYHGVAIWQVPGASAYTYTTDHVEIDADGAPNAYHPGDTGLDALGNAGYPNGGWRSVLAVDPNDGSAPYVQTTGPFAGYYVARTSLQDTRLAEIDPQRYVDATAFPYIVFPGNFNASAGTGMPGDFVMAKHIQTGKVSAAIVADIGPPTAPLVKSRSSWRSIWAARTPIRATGTARLAVQSAMSCFRDPTRRRNGGSASPKSRPGQPPHSKQPVGGSSSTPCLEARIELPAFKCKEGEKRGADRLTAKRRQTSPPRSTLSRPPPPRP